MEERPKAETKAETELKEASYAGQILVEKAESDMRILEYQWVNLLVIVTVSVNIVVVTVYTV